MTHKVGVFGDIHGNLPALEAVIGELRDANVSQYYCTGDMVGYVGWSNEVIRTLKELGAYCVPGNHDCRLRSDFYFNRDFPAAQAEQTVVSDQVTERQRSWLEGLSLRDQSNQVTLAHSWPKRGDDAQTLTGFSSYDYGVKPGLFPTAGAMLDTQFGFLGHTHEQHAVNLSKFEGQSGTLVNPGSVGIPRDGVAEYAIVDFDTGEYELCKASFDATRTSERVNELAESYDLPILTE